MTVAADAPHTGRRSLRGRTGLGTANGTFGELLQGALPETAIGSAEGRFLVTLPIARWAHARFMSGPPASGLTVSPAAKTKARAFAEILLRELGQRTDGMLVLRGNIPEGKGLASSSADLVATARAVCAAVNRPVPVARLARILVGIEPTDGVMYPGIVAFDHRRGAHLQSLGRLPALTVVAVDQGGLVDTVAFNHTVRDYRAGERRRYARMLDDLTTAVAKGDLAAVGRTATESAALNQTRMPNRNFGPLLELCRTLDGLGLVACHSGTMIGILLDPGGARYRAQLAGTVKAAGELPGRVHLYRTLA